MITTQGNSTSNATDGKPELVPTRQAPQKLIVEDHGPLSFMMDTAKFEHLQRLSKVMAYSSLLPDHLRHEKGNAKLPELPIEVIQSNCFRIVNQALRWQIDPFAMVDETYVVGGKLGYQGKLVAAVVNARAGLIGRLQARYSGTGDNRTVTISGQFAGEDQLRTIDLRLGDAKTDNQMWRKDPDQKLWYSGVTKWARRHCPEIVLGVLTDDDLERIRLESRSDFATSGSRLDKIGSVLAGDDQSDEVEGANNVNASDAEEAATTEEPAQASTDTVESEGADASFAPLEGETAKDYHTRVVKMIADSRTDEQLGEIFAAVNEAAASQFMNAIRTKDLITKLEARHAEMVAGQ